MTIKYDLNPLPIRTKKARFTTQDLKKAFKMGRNPFLSWAQTLYKIDKENKSRQQRKVGKLK